MATPDLRVGGGDRAHRNGGRPLSAREREVLGHLAEGMSGAEIAKELVLSPETVRTHVRNAMDKLGASTRSQAVALALEQGLIGELDQPARPAAVTAPRPRSDQGLERALGELTAGMVELADIDVAAVYLADESGMVLRLGSHATTNRSGGRAPDREVALGEAGVGRVALERRSQLVSSPTASGPMLGTPLVSGGRLLGVLCVGVRASRPVSRREMLLLEAFASRVADVVGSEVNRRAQLRLALQRFRASWTETLR